MATKMKAQTDPQTALRESLDELQSFEHVDGVLELIDKARRHMQFGNIERGLAYAKLGWHRVSSAVNGYLAATSAAYENAQ